MPAVALPQFRADLKRIVKYPPNPPADPPTITDVSAAISLFHEVRDACRLSHHTLSK